MWAYVTRPIALASKTEATMPAAGAKVIVMPSRAIQPSVVQRITRSQLGRAAILLPPMMLITGVLSAKGAELGATVGAGLRAMSAAVIGSSAIPWGWVAVIAGGALLFFGGLYYRKHLSRGARHLADFLVTA
jgi:hypothetical protein